MIVLEESASGNRNVNILNQTYKVEETRTEYKVDPFKNDGQIAFSLNRYTLSLMWIYPNYQEQDTLIYEASCSLLDEPKI